MRRVLAAAMGLALGLGLGGAVPAAAIVNPDRAGRVPWQALVTAQLSPKAALRCGATIRDALHVITAAHCTYDRSARPLPADALAVTAGVTRADTLEPTAQRRGVVAVSSHPDFALVGPTAVHDAAILTLDAPLDLRAPAVVAALPLAEPGAVAREGEFSGWGRTGPHRRGGVLHAATLDVLPSRACAAYGPRFVAATMLCAGRVRRDGEVTGGCNGDSGGGLVHAGRLVGIASFVGPRACGERRYPTVFVRVAAPGVYAFLRQPDPLPRPVSLAAPSVDGDPVAGGALHCRAGRFAGAETVTYAFARAPVIDGVADPRRAVPVVRPSPSDTYRFTGTELAQAVFCVARAANSGGATAVTSANGIGLGGSVPVRAAGLS